MKKKYLKKVIEIVNPSVKEEGKVVITDSYCWFDKRDVDGIILQSRNVLNRNFVDKYIDEHLSDTKLFTVGIKSGGSIKNVALTSTQLQYLCSDDD